MPAPTSPLTAEESVTFFRAHALQKTERRVGRKIWEPVLLEMIEDYYSLDEIIAWIAQYHESLGYKKPADITVRDWISQIRKERNMPLRRKKSNAALPAPALIDQSSPPEAPEAAAAPATKTPDPDPEPQAKHPELETKAAKPTALISQDKTSKPFDISEFKNLSMEEREKRAFGDQLKRDETGAVVSITPRKFGPSEKELAAYREKHSKKPDQSS